MQSGDFADDCVEECRAVGAGVPHLRVQSIRGDDDELLPGSEAVPRAGHLLPIVAGAVEENNDRQRGMRLGRDEVETGARPPGKQKCSPLYFVSCESGDAQGKKGDAEQNSAGP